MQSEVVGLGPAWESNGLKSWQKNQAATTPVRPMSQVIYLERSANRDYAGAVYETPGQPIFYEAPSGRRYNLDGNGRARAAPLDEVPAVNRGGESRPSPVYYIERAFDTGKIRGWYASAPGSREPLSVFKVKRLTEPLVSDRGNYLAAAEGGVDPSIPVSEAFSVGAGALGHMHRQGDPVFMLPAECPRPRESLPAARGPPGVYSRLTPCLMLILVAGLGLSWLACCDKHKKL